VDVSVHSLRDGWMLAIKSFCIPMVPLGVLCVFFITNTLRKGEVIPAVEIQYLSCDTPKKVYLIQVRDKIPYLKYF
jgi:hypothetical protein